MIKKRLITIILISVIMLAGFSLFSQQKPGITYFSAKSLYVYAMGSYGSYDPFDEYYYELGDTIAGAFSPVIGAGYRFINIRERFFLSLEADYARYRFDFGEYADNQKISELTFMIDLEWHLNTIPLAFSFGIGATLHHLYNLGYFDQNDTYIPVGDDTLTAATMRFGVKIPLSRSFTLRTEFRWSGDYYGDSYYNNYYWNDWHYYDDSEMNFISSAFCLGFEYHFR